jgi:hypothetical protein
MVSGFNTSPLEDAKMVSGDESPMEILLKSFCCCVSFIRAM